MNPLRIPADHRKSEAMTEEVFVSSGFPDRRRKRTPITAIAVSRPPVIITNDINIWIFLDRFYEDGSSYPAND